MIAIMIWIDIEYDTSNTTSNYIKMAETNYGTHYALDVVGNSILTLSDLPESEKTTIWKASPLKDEILYFFPNIQIMKEIFNDRVEDNGKFKTSFLNYMEATHDEYVGGNINKEEFKESILNPPISLIKLY
jgi:hypothetical protein